MEYSYSSYRYKLGNNDFNNQPSTIVIRIFNEAFRMLILNIRAVTKKMILDTHLFVFPSFIP